MKLTYVRLSLCVLSSTHVRSFIFLAFGFHPSLYIMPLFTKPYQALLAVSLMPLVQTISIYTNATVPSSITDACASALLSDVKCDAVVPALVTGDYYPETTLSRACTADCASSLANYQSDITSACVDDTWLGYGNETMPIAIIPEILRYNYNLTCLTVSASTRSSCRLD